MKYHLAADRPEFRRVYALAAELGVPILIQVIDSRLKPGCAEEQIVSTAIDLMRRTGQ